jgi:hypothetical protein
MIRLYSGPATNFSPMETEPCCAIAAVKKLPCGRSSSLGANTTIQQTSPKHRLVSQVLLVNRVKTLLAVGTSGDLMARQLRPYSIVR